jgi:hypothetical protein
MRKGSYSELWNKAFLKPSVHKACLELHLWTCLENEQTDLFDSYVL